VSACPTEGLRDMKVGIKASRVNAA